MRAFTRFFFCAAMFVFLLVGCVQNIYYFSDMTEMNNKRYNRNRYNPYRTYSSSYNDVVDISDEIEEIKDTDTPISDDSVEIEKKEYEDYNKDEVHPVTYYY